MVGSRSCINLGKSTDDSQGRVACIDVIADGGEPTMYAQRKNDSQRKSADDNFQAQIKRMRKLLINTNDDMTSTQLLLPRGRSLLYLSTL